MTDIVGASIPRIDVTYDQDVDAIGLLCPLPVLKARKCLLKMQIGDVLRLVATDPAAVIDVPHFCAETGHEFLGAQTVETSIGPAEAYFMRRG